MSLFKEFFGQEEEGIDPITDSNKTITENDEDRSEHVHNESTSSKASLDLLENHKEDSEDNVYRDLFGDPIQTTSAKRNVTATGKGSRSSSTVQSSAALKRSQQREWPDQNIEVGVDFTIHYATKTFLVSEVLEEIPESGSVHLNILREALFKLYWDFSEERTKWDYNLEEKKLRPIITGEKNN